MSVYIILQDNEIKGYLNEEEEAKKAVQELTDVLVSSLYKSPSSSNVRISREHIKDGINVYSQVLGTIINGPVSLQHVIRWKAIPVYLSVQANDREENTEL